MLVVVVVVAVVVVEDVVVVVVVVVVILVFGTGLMFKEHYQNITRKCNGQIFPEIMLRNIPKWALAFSQAVLWKVLDRSRTSTSGNRRRSRSGRIHFPETSLTRLGN